jgi:hypothetical protein
MRPRRIRLSRAKGWRMPAGAMKIDRSTRFGNPFRIGEDGEAADCVALYCGLLKDGVQFGAAASTTDQERARAAALEGMEHLRGHDLACWCRLCPRHADGKPAGESCRDCSPCHGDVLVEWANR